MKILFPAALAAVTALSCGAASAKTDPLVPGAFGGQRTAYAAPPPGPNSFNFSVNFEGGN